MDLPVPALPLRDPVAALTHLMASVFAVYVALLLCRMAGGDRVKQVSLACFGVAMVVLYAASGLYHAVPLPRDSAEVMFLRRVDLSAIYLLIAGTYTPPFAVLMRGRQRVVWLATVWLLAVVGASAKWLLPAPPDWLSLGLYLALGWLAVVPTPGLYRIVGMRGALWVFGGGACYMTGVACELARWPVLVPGLIGWHEVFHVCDIAGTAMHAGFMAQCVVPHVWPAPLPGGRGAPRPAPRPEGSRGQPVSAP
jgi:hemolysin III